MAGGVPTLWTPGDAAQKTEVLSGKTVRPPAYRAIDLKRDSAVAARLVHTQKVTGANPVLATIAPNPVTLTDIRHSGALRRMK